LLSFSACLSASQNVIELNLRQPFLLPECGGRGSISFTLKNEVSWRRVCSCQSWDSLSCQRGNDGKHFGDAEEVVCEREKAAWYITCHIYKFRQREQRHCIGCVVWLRGQRVTVAQFYRSSSEREGVTSGEPFHLVRRRRRKKTASRHKTILRHFGNIRSSFNSRINVFK
jgi:hypothetical protein